MIDISIVLPVLLPLMIAIFLLFFWGKVQSQKWISILGSLAVLGYSIWLFAKVYSGGLLTMQAGNWEAPFGITLVADVFSVTMILLTSIAGLAVSIFSAASISSSRIRFGYFPILHLLLMGLNGAFLTGDIFNLYVWFEIIIIASFVLMTLGSEKSQLESAVNYVVMNLLASVIFLTAIAILYGIAGTLNMADLSIKVAEIENRGLVNVTALLFFVGFGIKSAVFPLYFWLPSSYHTPPSAVAAIFGGLLTKVGVYALLRVFTLIFIPDSFLSTLLLAVAALTLITGAFGALIQSNARKMISYLIVCHIGFMMAGLAMYTDTALTGAAFYLIHDVIIKTNVFILLGIVFIMYGSFKLPELGGLYADYPKLAIVMALVLFSLVGIPPLSGFWPKLFLFEAAFDTESYIMIGALIFASFITLVVIAKLWSQIFWKANPKIVVVNRQLPSFMELSWSKRALLITPLLLLTAVSLYIGLGAENIVKLSSQIANDLMDPSAYIEAVLGTKSQTP